MKQVITSATMSPSCSKHSLHRDSHTISKLKPKIRIIHIIAPEIIKTDVEHFRDLVQRLTGKNAAQQVKGKKTKKDISQRKKNIESSPQDHHQQHQHMNMLQDTNYRMKEEVSEDTYGSVENSSNGFLSGFGSMEGFIQDLGEYPLFPNFKPTQINMFGEMPLC
ncbi:VQ motif-containing protein 25-like [Lycium barbarum]|uniref:VQ motif-containing protein 25-like n=1 Tax=Lycium barbarum TaxID=112863 RepID=UPI00293F19DA|nr:VQ motif-containing protein 25-like [Lycium barbarum]